MIGVNMDRIGPSTAALATRNLAKQMEDHNKDGAYICNGNEQWVSGSLIGSYTGTADVTRRDGCQLEQVIRIGNTVKFTLRITGPNFGLKFSNDDWSDLSLIRMAEAVKDDLPFSEDFYRMIAPFSAIRWMNWTLANDSTVKSYDDRPKMRDRNWTRGGPWEIVFSESARLKKDCYINIPHLWGDDDVIKLAAMAKQLLRDSGVTVYLENSNEYWNWQFGQAKYFEETASKNPWSGPDTNGNRHKLHAHRTVRFAKMFNEGGVKCKSVLGLQISDSGTGIKLLDWMKQSGLGKADYIAVSGYYGGSGLKESSSVADVIANYKAAAERYGTPESQSTGAVIKLRDAAKQYGTATLVYEGGPESMSSLPALSSRIAANRQSDCSLGLLIDRAVGLGLVDFYIYKIASAFNKSGQYGLYARPGEVLPKMTAAAAAAKKYAPVIVPDTIVQVTGVKVADLGDKYSITWDKVTGATYKVYLDGVYMIGSTDELAYTARKVPGTITVTAVINGVEGPRSAGIVLGAELLAEKTKLQADYLAQVDQMKSLKDELVVINGRVFALSTTMAQNSARIAEIDKLLGV